MLISDDLPTLLRPMKANSGLSGAGASVRSGLLITYSAVLISISQRYVTLEQESNPLNSECPCDHTENVVERLGRQCAAAGIPVMPQPYHRLPVVPSLAVASRQWIRNLIKEYLVFREAHPTPFSKNRSEPFKESQRTQKTFSPISARIRWMRPSRQALSTMKRLFRINNRPKADLA
jgi:hypothetical protein